MSTQHKLTTREQRKKLAPRDAPYYVELRRGLHLGYRKGTTGGSWRLREHRGGKFVKRRLGAADDEGGADGINTLSWDQACQAARGEDRPTVTKPSALTVDQASEDYFATRQGEVGYDRKRYARIAGKLGSRSISELTTGELEAWRAGRVQIDPDMEDEREARRKKQATANREWTLVRAILNSAYSKDQNRVPSADAWRRIKPFRNVDRPRTRVLTEREMAAFLGKLDTAWRPLVKAAIFSGLRLAELLRLRVSNLADGTLRVENAKGGKHRLVPLNQEGQKHFKSLAKGKEKGALLLGLQDSGSLRIALLRARMAACEAAKLEHTTFHDLRRSYGSHLLNDGANLAAVSVLLGHADTRMTQRVYAHVSMDTLRKVVEAHAPRLGTRTKKKSRSAN